MTDTTPPQPEILPARRSPLRNLSLIWLVPIVALVVSLAIAWQSYAERGVLVEIRFDNAAGVTVEQTTVRYRDVNIGIVETVEFTEDLANVVVGARIDQTVAANLPEDTQFWVVRPEVSAAGISGLSTVLSGVYIEAGFEPDNGAAATEFVGLQSTPLVRPGSNGTRITLQAPNGSSLSPGAPIFFRGIVVGQLETPRLLESGTGVVADAFIEAPHDQRLTTATRFWDTSGFSFSFGAGGLDVSVESLAALVRGGVAFDTVFSGGNAVEPGNVFNLFPSESAARDSVFNALDADAVQLTIQFNDSVSGLEAGSPVLFRGLQVGVVNAIGAVIEETPAGPEVRLRATIGIDPQAIGLPDEAGEAETLAFLGEEVSRGLRAVLSTRNLFSTALIIELAIVEDAAPASLGVFGGEFPVMPSAPSDLPDVTATAQGLLERINALPVEELMQQTISLLASIEAVAASEGTQEVPDVLLALLQDARGVIGAPEVQALPEDIGAALADVRAVLEELRTAQAATQLVEALDAAENAAGAVTTAIADVPGLVADLRDLSQTVAALEVDQLVSDAGQILATTDALLSDPATQSLPASVAGALEDARTALAGFTAEGGIVPNANAAITDLRGVVTDISDAQLAQQLTDALAAAESAAGAVTTSVEGVPELVADLSALSQKANGLALEALVDEAAAVLASADQILASPGAQSLPAEVSGALADARAVIAGLTGDGGIVPNANAAITDLRGVVTDISDAQLAQQLTDALAAAESAAGAVTLSVAGVPELVADLSELSQKANTLALEELVSEASALLASADEILGNPATLGLPADIAGALASARAAITDLTGPDGLVPNANAAVGDLRGVIDGLQQADVAQQLADALAAAEAAAADVSTSIEGVPQLVEDLRGLAATANDLELQALVNQSSDLLDAADRLIDTDAARDLPRALGAALDEARGALAELRDGGVIENTNATLASARAAAASVANAADTLPDLSRRLQGLVSEAQGTLAGYGDRSTFNRDTLATLREIREAADAVAKLARTIERNPNSLLLGR